jgi:hypothetical protein
LVFFTIFPFFFSSNNNNKSYFLLYRRWQQAWTQVIFIILFFLCKSFLTKIVNFFGHYNCITLPIPISHLWRVWPNITLGCNHINMYQKQS